jgi:hypothetical protein
MGTTGLPQFLDRYGQPLAMMGQLAQQQVSAPPLPGSDPASAYFYLYNKRQALLDSINQRPLLRLWDENMSLIGTIGQEQSVEVEEVMADSGSGNCVIRQDNWLSNFILFDRRAEQDLHFTLDPTPTQRSWKTRWAGKITTINAKRDSQGLHTIELEMVHIREHLKHLLIGANPVFPPEIQIPKMYFLPWNVRFGVFSTLFINLARQFFPLLSIPDNIANPFGWIGVGDVLGGLDPLLWPICPQFVDPILDQSRFEVLAARWNDAHTAFLPQLTDAGCQVRAYQFIAGEDTESPHPELSALLGTPVLPERNQIILAAEDKSGTTGPTGTLADGFIKFLASTGDDLITDTLIPDPDMFPDTEVPSQIYPLIETWFGVAPNPPWVVFKDDQYSGIVESTRSVHGATAKTIMTGGRSPGWVNDLQSFLIKWGLSQLQTVFTGGQFAQVGPAPLGAGLDEVYQGEGDDTLFAYERYSDPVRELYCGDFGFLEHWEAGTGTAYVVSGILSLRDGLWKTRAWTSFKVAVQNGYPYIFNTDFTLGDRLGFTMAQSIYVDQLYAYQYAYSRDNPPQYALQIGSGQNEADPLFQATNSLAAVWNMFGMYMGSSQLF